MNAAATLEDLIPPRSRRVSVESTSVYGLDRSSDYHRACLRCDGFDINLYLDTYHNELVYLDITAKAYKTFFGFRTSQSKNSASLIFFKEEISQLPPLLNKFSPNLAEGYELAFRLGLLKMYAERIWDAQNDKDFWGEKAKKKWWQIWRR